MSFRRLVPALALSILAAAPADAGVLVGRTYPSAQSIAGGGPAVVLKQAAGVLSSTFNLTAAGTVVVTYTAECAVGATNGFVTLEVYVDGVVRAPSIGPDDRFCSSDTTVAVDRQGMRSIAVPVFLGVGAHTLQIKALAPVAGATAVIDDATTVVQN